MRSSRVLPAVLAQSIADQILPVVGNGTLIDDVDIAGLQIPANQIAGNNQLMR